MILLALPKSHSFRTDGCRRTAASLGVVVDSVANISFGRRIILALQGLSWITSHNKQNTGQRQLSLACRLMHGQRGPTVVLLLLRKSARWILVRRLVGGLMLTPESRNACVPFIWTWLCSHGFTNRPISRVNVRYYLRTRDDHELGSGCPLVCSFRCQWPSECYVCSVTEVQAGTHVKSSANQRCSYFSWPHRKDGSLPTLRTMAMNQMYGKETTASECPAELVKSSGIHESKPPSMIEKMGTTNAPA